MEWEEASGCDRDSGVNNSSIRKEEVVGGGGREERSIDAGAEGVLYVKVMTDEQIEILRRQIAVYAIICEQLVEMHKAITAQQDSLAGMRLGGLYTDSLMVPGGHKITARQRWTPTSMQLQILESMFEQGHGTPSKQKIKEITVELSQHGHISETNVYNWFQNRRARSKRKQTASPLQSNSEYEVEADDESLPNDQKRQHNDDSLLRSLRDAQMNDGMHLLNAGHQTQRVYQSNEGSRSSDDSGRISYLENFLSNQRLDQLMGSMDIPGSFSSFNSGENFDMMG